MLLEQQIQKDYVQAMKDKNSVTSSCLSFLRAQIKNVIIDKRVEKLDDLEVVAIIKKQIKQRQDSIEQFKQGNRPDLVDKETVEMGILKKYLPQELSEDELKIIVAEVVKEMGAVTVKDMGRIMKEVVAKAAGRADNKMISELVKAALSAV
ncbi:MAG: GatB/YqeY domain-containing protein [Candidatus Omnitrophica bacterium]|nr:GatB/YqeY domain-containing protein [Candidatus Omnitrophota bacterium]